GVNPGSDGTGNGPGTDPADTGGTGTTTADDPADAADGDPDGDGDSAGQDGPAASDGDPAADGSGSTDPDPADRGTDGGPDELDGELAAGQDTGGADGESTPWGVLIAVVLVAALAVASIVRSRARRHDPASPSA
ncbi:MAG: hypothetical protein ACK4V6_20770, partial [Microthrixaceae bacterium]